MTTTIRPIGLGDFDSGHPRNSNSDISPPLSARLPPLQTQAANQWSSKNIWGFSSTGGTGFGAVGRPKDASEDRRSPSLLSPTGSAPWSRPYGLPSPTEPSSNDFASKRLPSSLDKNYAIPPTFQSASQLSSKVSPSSGLSLKTQGFGENGMYRRPSEINSARPTFNRIGSFAMSPREGPEYQKQIGRQSLPTWDNQVSTQTQPSLVSRSTSFSRQSPPYLQGFGDKGNDFTLESTAWSSARPVVARDNLRNQRSTSSSSSLRPHNVDDQYDLEGSFEKLGVANVSEFTPSFSHWPSAKDTKPAYTTQPYGSRNNSIAQPGDSRAIQPAWRSETIPRSLTSNRPDPSRDLHPLYTSQQDYETLQRQTDESSLYRLPPTANAYSTRDMPPSMDPQLQARLMQLDRKALLASQDQEDMVHQYMQHMMQPNLRGQYFAAVPYGFPAMGHPGVTPFIQLSQLPPMMSSHRMPLSDTAPGLRSPLLDEYLNSMKSNVRRYELRDIYEYIVEFSGNQHGSKFIQNKLETATSDEKERVFREIMPNAIQLMKDVYGNYVIQKFFERGDQSQKTALFNVMTGKIFELSCQVYGCRVVQTALQHVLVHQQATMVEELKNHVLDCVRDQNGNHVIQIVVKAVPAEYTQFVVDAFIGQVQHLATHPYGCRVMQRLLDHCVEPGRSQILRELHACASTLVSDQYGNYVTQHVIEHGNPEDRAKIITLVVQHLIPYSKQKFASNVVEKCLTFGNDEQRRDIMHQVSVKGVNGETALPFLIKDSFGNYVIQRLLDTLSPPDYAQFVDILAPEIAALRRLAPNNKQVDNVAKKMYRHDMPYPSMSSYHNPGLTPANFDVSSTMPALTFAQNSPFSTSQPSLSDDAPLASQQVNDPQMESGAEIRIEVTDH